MVPNPAPAPPPAPPRESTLPLQRAAEGRPVIDPYTSFMDTIYTSFLQVNAKEQEDGAYLSPSDPTSPFCALTPVSFHAEHQPPPTPVTNLPQASAPVSLSPRRACSLRNPDLSRLNLEAVAHSPAQGTPKPSEEGSTPPLQRKPVMVEGHTHTEPPLPPPYLEEAKTDCTGPAAALCPFGESGLDRKGHLPHTGYLSPRDGRSNEETAGTILHSEQGRVSGLTSWLSLDHHRGFFLSCHNRILFEKTTSTSFCGDCVEFLVTSVFCVSQGSRRSSRCSQKRKKKETNVSTLNRFLSTFNQSTFACEAPNHSK